MKIIKNLITNIVISAVLLYIFDYFQLGIEIQGLEMNFNDAKSLIYSIGLFLVLGFIFRIFNAPIKWILKTLSCPVNFLTLGLLSLIINVAVFYLFQYFANFFFDGELIINLGNVLQTLILSFVMAIGTAILKKIL